MNALYDKFVTNLSYVQKTIYEGTHSRMDKGKSF